MSAAPGFPLELRGEQIVLREIRLTDVTSTFRWTSDPVFFQFLAVDAMESEAQEAAYLQSVYDAARTVPRTSYELGVAVRATDELIGMIRLRITSVEHREADLAGGVDPAWSRRGVATAAAALLVEFGFNELSLHRITATHHPDNEGSAHVLAKLGMQREGRLRENYLAHGVWRDSILYSILEDEWPATSVG
jgi:RimJ/RimL family protein N-acetyltransferase